MKYNRILLKLSGEALLGKNSYGIDNDRLVVFAEEIKQIHVQGVEIAIVIGGGNIFRGLTGSEDGIDRVQADYMGMLATVINGLALQNALENINIPTRLQSAIKMESIAEPFIKRKATRHLEKGRVVIFASGTGNPYFTTDSAAVLRAIEINADVILKGTRVDGIYNEDPEKNKEAIKFDDISFEETIKKGLKIMDTTAFTLSKENELPIIVFDMNTKGNLAKVVMGEKLELKFLNNFNMENNQEIIENAELNMMSSINHLETELAKIRAGKANPIMLKGVSVEYYGNMTPLNQVASISTPNAQTISIQPWEKDLLEEIEKSIINSNLGLNPVNNGESLLINIPPLTEERRLELTKLAKSESESAKVSIRNTRKDANNKIKGLDISDDLKSNLEIDSQELTDKYIKKVDEMFTLKEKDILTL